MSHIFFFPFWFFTSEDSSSITNFDWYNGEEIIERSWRQEADSDWWNSFTQTVCWKGNLNNLFKNVLKWNFFLHKIFKDFLKIVSINLADLKDLYIAWIVRLNYVQRKVGYLELYLWASWTFPHRWEATLTNYWIENNVTVCLGREGLLIGWPRFHHCWVFVIYRCRDARISGRPIWAVWFYI